MSKRSDRFDELRHFITSMSNHLASMNTQLGQLNNRLDRWETRTHHNRTKQAAHLCVAPKEIVKEEQAIRKEVAVLFPTPEEEEGDILSKEEEPVLLLAPKEEEGEIRSIVDFPIQIQTRENRPTKVQPVPKEFPLNFPDVLPSGLTPIKEVKLLSSGSIDMVAVQLVMTVEYEPTPIRELCLSIHRSIPFTNLFSISKEVGRTWQVKNFFFNIMLFCRLVRICRRFVKDRGRKRISHNPRAWAWAFFRPKESPF